MKYERRQSKREVRKSAECYNREGDKCDDTISNERKYDEPGKEEEDGDDIESGQRRDAGPVGAAHKVLSDVCADMGWMPPLSKSKIAASPLLQKSSHEGTSKTQHEADNPNRVHEYD